MRLQAALVVTLLSCGGGTTSPHGALPVPGPPDPGPRLERRVGKASVTKLPDLTVRASGMFAEGDHFYVKLPLGREDGSTYGSPIVRIAVGGSRYAFAVPAEPGAIFVRFTGGAAPPEGQELMLFSTQHIRHSSVLGGGSVQRVRVEGIGAAPATPGLPREFLSAAAEWFRAHSQEGRHTQPFASFAAGRLAWLAAGTPTEAWATGAWSRRTELAELMSLYTGLESVEEAMQTDRGLLIRQSPDARADAGQQRTIDPRELSGVPLPAHPWDAMLAAAGAPKPVTEPLAAVVPADLLYLHFHDLGTFATLADEVDGWAWPLLETLEQRGGAAHVIERYETQLAIERTELTKRLGNLVAGGVAITASDPLLREGTDVALVFKVRNRTLLVGMLEDQATRVAARHPGAARSEYVLGGATVKLLATPDHRVYRHQLELGDVLVIANSRAALARFVEVRDGQRPSLAASGDFRWMRALYPFDPASEDGFAFAGDALIAALVGPRAKILEARRMEARADLLAVNHAALLFGWLEGRTPRDVEELVHSGLLRREELTHADGEPIDFAPARGAESRWGNVAALAPLAELELGKVSPAERAAYQRFVDTYQNYWRGYIDPIAVRIRRQDGGRSLSFDARMLPLIRGSDYDHLIAEAGEHTVLPPHIRAGARFTLALGADAKLRREIDGVARDITGRRDIGLSWLGDWVAIGVADRSGLWDAALAARDIVELDGDPRRHKDLEIFTHLPIYVAAQVKSRVALAATLAGVHAFVETSAAGLVDWHAGAPHHGVETVIIEERPRDGRRRELGGVALHYAIPGDQLILSLDRATLEQLIDQVNAGRAPEGTPAQVAVMVSPGAAQGWLARTLTGLLENDAIVATRAAAHTYEALYFGLGGATGAFPAADAAERRRLALAYLGLEPRSPQGGELTIDASGLVVHSIDGSDVEPAIPDARAEAGTPLARVMDALADLALTLACEGKNEQRGLHVTGAWHWRP